MQEVPAGPPTAAFRHLRGNHKKNKGCWSKLSALTWSQRLTVLFLLAGFIGSILFILWIFWPRQADASPPAPVLVTTIPPLESPSPEPEGSPSPSAGEGQGGSPELVEGGGLEPLQIAATATAHYLYSRPAVVVSDAAPFFVGVISYEAGCSVSNIGFTTAGYTGEPFYLYFNQPLDRDPMMQMVNITGFVQQFDNCAHPVIMVQQIFWLDNLGTPAPISSIAIISGTSAITATNVWGLGGLPTPNKLHTPIYNPASWTATPYPTYTPFPSATPYVPPPPSTRVVYVTVEPDDTATPTRTPTATPTPQAANLTGRVINIAGCNQTNLAVETAPGQQVLLLFAGAALPPTGSPTDYYAIVSGLLSNVCGQTAINAQTIIWYAATATPTPTPTDTPTSTPTPTATPTTEPTTEPTQETAQ